MQEQLGKILIDIGITLIPVSIALLYSSESFLPIDFIELLILALLFIVFGFMCRFA